MTKKDWRDTGATCNKQRITNQSLNILNNSDQYDTASCIATKRIQSINTVIIQGNTRNAVLNVYNCVKNIYAKAREG